MSMPVGREDFRGWNDQMSRKYDPDAFHHHPSRLIRWVEGKRVRIVLDCLQPRAGERILEIGCGAGNVLEQVRPAKIFGIDLSAHLLKKALKRVGERGCLFQAYGEVLCFKDKVFQKLYCTEVLEHVLKPEEIIREASRILTDGGRAIFSIPNEGKINKIKSLLRRLGLFKFIFQKPKSGYQVPEKMEDEWHLHQFDLPKFRAILPSSLAIEKIVAIPTRLLPLRYVISCTKTESHQT